jgi:adenylate cyclase
VSPSPEVADGDRRALGESPLDVSLIAANVPFVLRTALGTAVLGIGTNVVGVLVVTLLVVAMNANADHHQLTVMVGVAGIVTVVAVVLGLLSAILIQRRTLRWLLRGERPSTVDAHRALRMPRDMAVIAAVFWALGSVAIGIAAAAVGEDGQTVLGIVGGSVLAGCTTAGITYLLVGRASQPIARLALASCPPETAPVFGVRWRLLINWVLTSGTPIVALVFVLSAPRGKTHIVGASVIVAVTALLVGGFSTALAARAIGAPLREMVDALHRVGQGDLDVVAPIEDAGEIGLLQSGFNEMVSGLRERERIQDLFGRHVGPAVAAEAITSGVTLSGESREVVALFVDITGSTKLTLESEPAEFVAKLNRFFEVVVDEVEGNGGLLNKFEGDAALCIFGAPVELDDPATAALCTARAVRDRVVKMGELDIGIGVASGPVIAGQIGAASRLEYTVIGDAVNEAARLTDQAKRIEGRILASEATVLAATPEEQEHWVKGPVLRLRGREAPTPSYRNAVPGASGPSLARRISDAAKVVTEFPQHGAHERE